MSSSPFKVIVIGGGPGGLTAAHSLHLAGIDFVVLERRTTIVEDLGASLVLTPPSLRVMHQFGLLEDLLEVGQELLHSRSFDLDGNIINDSTAFEIIHKNHGMSPMAFHRAKLVEILYEGLPASAQSKILLGKKLRDIQSDDNGVLVTCEDGSSYSGSIVLGADGVHSKTRQIMRQLALESNPSQPWDQKQPFASAYRCMWCSFPRPSAPGEAFDTQHKDKSVMYLAGKERSWTFLYQKLPELTRERADYSESDMQAYVEQFKDFPITEKLKVKDVWGTRLTAGMANLEEGVATNWSWGRIVLAGDAAHKFTPNAGRGLNTGIQDVVTLCNGLQSLQSVSSSAPPSGSQELSLLTNFFETYTSVRKSALSLDMNQSAIITRTQAWASPLYYFAARYVMTWKFVEYIMIGILGKWNIKKALILDYVDVDEPMDGAVAWDHPLKGSAKGLHAEVSA